MKTTDFTYGEKTIHLYFNSQAMFEVNELEKNEEESLVDSLDPASPAGVEKLCDVTSILATQGEHCRRYLQYTAERIPPAEELKTILSPTQMIGLYTAVLKTINDGYDQGKVESGDIDTGLVELEKKTVYNAAAIFTNRRSLSYSAPGRAAFVPARGNFRHLLRISS